MIFFSMLVLKIVKYVLKNRQNTNYVLINKNMKNNFCIIIPRVKIGHSN